MPASYGDNDSLSLLYDGSNCPINESWQELAVVGKSWQELAIVGKSWRNPSSRHVILSSIPRPVSSHDSVVFRNGKQAYLNSRQGTSRKG